VVHAIVTGYRYGIQLVRSFPETQLTLTLGKKQFKPDFQMTLQAPTGEHFRFLIELDNSTEPLDATDPKRESTVRKSRSTNDSRITGFLDGSEAAVKGTRRGFGCSSLREATYVYAT